jgi:hypothetical protein
MNNEHERIWTGDGVKMAMCKVLTAETTTARRHGNKREHRTRELRAHQTPIHSCSTTPYIHASHCTDMYHTHTIHTRTKLRGARTTA